FRPGTPEGDRLLRHEAAHVLQQEGQPRGIQHDDDAILQAWLNHPTPLFAYTELRAILSPEDWTALNAAAHQRMRNALAGACLEDPTGVRMIREVSLPVAELFLPTATPRRRANWAVDAFSLAYGQAVQGQEMDQQAVARMMEEDELCRWIDANPTIMAGQVKVSLIDPFGQAKIPSSLLFSLGEHPIQTLDGGLYAGLLDHAGSGSLPAIREQTRLDAQALAQALSAAIPAYRAKEAGSAVLGTEHLRLAQQAIVQAHTASRHSHLLLEGLSSPYTALVAALKLELTVQVQDLQTFYEEHAEWRERHPREPTETEQHMGRQRVLTQHLRGEPVVGLMPLTTALFSNAAHRMSNAFRGGQYDLLQGAADTYDRGQVSRLSYDAYVAAVRARGDAMVFTAAALVVLSIGVGFLLPPLGIVGSGLVFGGMGALEAVIPMMVGDAMVSGTDLDGPVANAMWKEVRFRPGDYGRAAAMGFGIGALLGGGGAAVRAWRQGPAMLHAAAQGAELPVIPGARSTVLSPGRIRVEVPGQLGHMEFTSGGWQLWGPTGEVGTMRVLQSGGWARNVAGAPDDLLAGTMHQHPFGVGVGPRGWGVATPDGMQQVGLWGAESFPGSARWAPNPGSIAPDPVAGPLGGAVRVRSAAPARLAHSPTPAARRIADDLFLSLRDDFAQNVTGRNFRQWERRLLDEGYHPATIRDIVEHGSIVKGENPFGGGEGWRRYYEEISGRPFPTTDEMVRPHAHHLAEKVGGGPSGAMNRQILEEVGIDPLLSRHNLEWAPNVAGQHGAGPQGELLMLLLPVRGDRAGVIRVLGEWRAVARAR
ncbi:MAG: hypothetical protein ACI9VR_001788, partial [Cognaticolwellia sp.]